MKLADILDVDNLAQHVAAGTVAEVHHPTEGDYPVDAPRSRCVVRGR